MGWGRSGRPIPPLHAARGPDPRAQVSALHRTRLRRGPLCLLADVRAARWVPVSSTGTTSVGWRRLGQSGSDPGLTSVRWGRSARPIPPSTPLADLIREPRSRHGITPRATVPARRRPNGTLGTRVKHGHAVVGVVEFSETDPASLTPLADLIREPRSRHGFNPACTVPRRWPNADSWAAHWIPGSSPGKASVGVVERGSPDPPHHAACGETGARVPDTSRAKKQRGAAVCAAAPPIFNQCCRRIRPG